MIPVTIQRSKWSHGDKVRNALLISQATIDGIDLEGYEDPIEDRMPVIGQKCCLGFACNALGLYDEDIADKGMPHNLNNAARDIVMETMLEKIDYGYGVENRRWVNDAQVVNDANIGELIWLGKSTESNDGRLELRDEAHREELITELFKLGGLDATFVD